MSERNDPARDPRTADLRSRLDAPRTLDFEEGGPSARLVAEILAGGSALGLYDRSDIAAWALEVVEREAEPPTPVIELAMGSRLDDSAMAELLHTVPGHFAPEAVRGALVGVVAVAVVSGRLDARSAARALYTLCIDATGELHELAHFDDGFCLAEDGSYGSPAEVAAALRERLCAFERLAAGVPIPGRYAANG